MSVELQFLGSLLDGGFPPSKITEFGVEHTYFTPEVQKLYLYIKNHYLIHGQLPSNEAMEDDCGMLPDFDCKEPPAYYADKIIKRHKENVIKKELNAAIDSLIKQDPDKALETVKNLVGTCGKIGIIDESSMQDAREVAEKRAKEYFDRMAHPEVIQGIKWPWPHMNEQTQGMHKGELYFIVARLKQGKTWTLVALMDEVIKSNTPAMIVTMEMPVDKVLRRFESKTSGVGFGSFLKHTLTQTEKENYVNAVKRMQTGNSPLWVVGNGRVRTVQDIELLIEEKHPRVVLIDGVYLLGIDGQKGVSKWERVSAVVDELQKLAQRKQVSILATTQFNRGVKKGTKDVDASDIGFAYEVGQAADILMGLVQDDDMKLNKEMVLKIMERREGETFNLKIRWDFDTMDFSEIGVVTDDELGMKSLKEDEPEAIF